MKPTSLVILSRWLGFSILIGLAACQGQQPAQNQANSRTISNPYNSNVRGNLYHSQRKDLELEFSTRVWRVEKGPYPLHLVAKDKVAQVLLGSRFRIGFSRDLEGAARKQLRRIGFRDFEIEAQEPAQVDGQAGLVVTAKGQFVVDRSSNLRIDRKIRLLVVLTGPRLYWMAYVAPLDTFEANLEALQELQSHLKFLSSGA